MTTTSGGNVTGPGGGRVNPYLQQGQGNQSGQQQNPVTLMFTRAVEPDRESPPPQQAKPKGTLLSIGEKIGSALGIISKKAPPAPAAAASSSSTSQNAALRQEWQEAIRTNRQFPNQLNKVDENTTLEEFRLMKATFEHQQVQAKIFQRNQNDPEYPSLVTMRKQADQEVIAAQKAYKTAFEADNLTSIPKTASKPQTAQSALVQQSPSTSIPPKPLSTPPAPPQSTASQNQSLPPSSQYQNKAKELRLFWLQDNIEDRYEDSLEAYVLEEAKHKVHTIEEALKNPKLTAQQATDLNKQATEALNFQKEAQRVFDEAKRAEKQTFYQDTTPNTSYDPTVFHSFKIPFSLDREGVDLANSYQFVEVKKNAATKKITGVDDLNLIDRQQLVQKAKQLLTVLYSKHPELDRFEYQPALELTALILVMQSLEEVIVKPREFVVLLDTIIAIRDSEEARKDPTAFHKYVSILTSPYSEPDEIDRVKRRFPGTKLTDAGLNTQTLLAMQRQFLNAIDWNLESIKPLPKEVTPAKKAQVEKSFEEAQAKLQSSLAKVLDLKAQLQKTAADRESAFNLFQSAPGAEKQQHDKNFQTANAQMEMLKSTMKNELVVYKAATKEYFDRFEEVHHLTPLSSQRESIQQKMNDALDQLGNHPEVKELRTKLRDLNNQFSSYINNLPEVIQLRANIAHNTKELEKNPINLFFQGQINADEKRINEIIKHDSRSADLQKQIRQTERTLQLVYENDPEAYFLKEQQLFYSDLLTEASW